jgi:DNA-binding LacI/PurR family transcriptional regulator
VESTKAAVCLQHGQGSALAEIAGAAGVSVPTVSKVLNDRADVSPETRRRVQKYLRDSEYRPTGQLRFSPAPRVEPIHRGRRSVAQMISNDVVGTRHIELATRLVVRDSTAPLHG